MYSNAFLNKGCAEKYLLALEIVSTIIIVFLTSPQPLSILRRRSGWRELEIGSF